MEKDPKRKVISFEVKSDDEEDVILKYILYEKKLD